MKKLLSLLLAASFILSAVVLPVSAESAEAFTVSVNTVNAAQAQNDIVVPVRLSGNPGISGFSFCVEYDTDNLVLVESEITIDSGYKVIRETSGDGLNLAWTGADIYTDNGTVANLYFNIVPDATVGKADVRIKYRDGYDSFYKTVDGEEQDISVVSSDGGVNISNIEAVYDLLLNVGNASAALNETDIVIPISVENNTGISGFSFCVNYDTTRLNLENADIALSDGYKVTSKPDGYEVNLAWTSENGFANNGIIANLHFSVKENATPGKGYINVLFRDSYDSFYKVVGGQETDIVCTVINGYIDVADHSYGDWIIVKEATCKETGLKRRICTDPYCGKTDEVIIPKAPHQYIETVVPATCEEQGFTKHTCSVCEDVFFDNYTDALPHSLGDWELSVAPDCTNSGEEVQKCTACQAVINRRSIAALGHSYGEWIVTVQPTETTPGKKERTCSVCDFKEDQTIDPVGNIPKITVEDTFAKLDEEFTVNVVIEDNPGIIAMSLKIGYDSDVLELLSATAQDYSELSFGSISTNPFVVSWEDVLSGNNSTSGTFVQLTFKVKSSVAVSSTQITVSYDDDNVFNADFDNVFFEIQTGEIGIIRYQPGDVNRDGKVNLKDYALLKQYINGWEVDIELSVADVTGDEKINLKDLALLKQYINGWDVVLK